MSDQTTTDLIHVKTDIKSSRFKSVVEKAKTAVPYVAGAIVGSGCAFALYRTLLSPLDEDETFFGDGAVEASE